MRVFSGRRRLRRWLLLANEERFVALQDATGSGSGAEFCEPVSGRAAGPRAGSGRGAFAFSACCLNSHFPSCLLYNLLFKSSQQVMRSLTVALVRPHGSCVCACAECCFLHMRSPSTCRCHPKRTHCTQMLVPPSSLIEIFCVLRPQRAAGSIAIAPDTFGPLITHSCAKGFSCCCS